LKRRLFDVLTTLSLLLCVATAAWWVRSYWAPDEVSWPGERVSADGYRRSHYNLISYRGRIAFRVSAQDFRPLPPGMAQRYADEYRRTTTGGFSVHRPNLSPPFMMPVGGWWARRGFSYHTFGASQTPTIYNEQSQWTAPYWAVVGPLAVLPATYGAHRWLSRRRSRPGACPNCGYDLRATPDRCPECGKSGTVAFQNEVHG
jgi:hypothetical protein